MCKIVLNLSYRSPWSDSLCGQLGDLVLQCTKWPAGVGFNFIVAATPLFGEHFLCVFIFYELSISHYIKNKMRAKLLSAKH